MPVVFRGAAIGGVMALVVQVSGPTPLRSVVSGSVQLALRSVVELPVHAGVAGAGKRVIAAAPGSLSHLQMPECHDAACAGR